jgi:hypothetical protein
MIWLWRPSSRKAVSLGLGSFLQKHPELL